MNKVFLVFGTRPEAIKMCPLYRDLKKDSSLDVSCIVTAQHREMLDSVLRFFKVVPDYDLDIMCHGQTLTGITNAVLSGLDKIFEDDRPGLVLVHGDTTTAMASALAAFYRRIPVGHVEAGLRSFDMYSPYPEEMNRRAVDMLSALHFAATPLNVENLKKEGICQDGISVTGNTVIDALRYSYSENYSFSDPFLSKLDFNIPTVLLTCHRRENLGDSMKDIFTALKEVMERHPEIQCIFPMHKNQAVRNIFKSVGIETDKMHCIEPLDYPDFIHLMSRCKVILSDSGGIQEEAPYFGCPVVVVRDVTEREEAVEAGTVLLAGTKKDNVKKALLTLLEDSSVYEKMSKTTNPYGDGHAGERIRDVIVKWFSRAEEFC